MNPLARLNFARTGKRKQMKAWMFLIVSSLVVVAACSSSASRRESKEAAQASPSPTNVSTAGADSVTAVSVPTSVYTELSGPPCSQEKETGMVSSEHDCPGVVGYRLIVTNVDDRASITAITPEKKKYDLGFPMICNSGFASVGQKAEWRVVDQSGRQVPIALIVRVNCQSLNGLAKIISYLSVSKITEHEVCITDRIPPVRDANVQARVAADASAGKPCLKLPEG